MNTAKENRTQWASPFGFIMASVGAALGLGNIWGFPYRMGQHGSFAFLLFYILFVLLAGFPVLLAEMAIGRRGGPSAPEAYGIFGRRFRLVGIASLIACLLILSYYCFFGGMLLQAIFAQLGMPFGSGVFWSFIFLALTAAIVLSGVQKGIEQFSKLIIPLLVLILIFIVFCSLTAADSRDALRELMKPHAADFNIRCASSALTQVFFSMSLGQGCMMVYGAYTHPGSRLARQAVFIPLFDTLTAILSAFAILPAAAAQGIDPASGPSLMFETIPVLFGSGRIGELLTLLFFVLVFLAALTSTISMLETPAASLCHGKRFSKKTGILLTAGIAFFLGLPVCLSYGRTFSWLEIYQFLSEYILIMLVSLSTCALVAFAWKNQAIPELFASTHSRSGQFWLFLLKYITIPLLLFVILSFLLSLLPGYIS